MTVMTRYAHGVPSWVDLATPDPAASREFYGELFGWTATEEPTDRPGVSYTMARKGEHAAAGMMLLSDEMAAGGMPPVWTTYVTVDDLEATVAKVEPAGGTVLQPPSTSWTPAAWRCSPTRPGWSSRSGRPRSTSAARS